jgi:hypothetical protein
MIDRERTLDDTSAGPLEQTSQREDVGYEEGSILDYPDHPCAKILPPLLEPEFATLLADVRDYGHREPIFIHDGHMLEGRDRYRACLEIGVQPKFDTYEGGDPIGFLLSRTVRRRHLNESQRACVAAKLVTMGHGGDRKSVQDANLHFDQTAAAVLLGVSKRSVASAAKVLNRGDPELVRAVEHGRLSISAAAAAVGLSPGRQKAAASAALEGDLKSARAILGSPEGGGRDQDERLACSATSPAVVAIDLDLTFELAHQERPTGQVVAGPYPDRGLNRIKARLASIGATDSVLFALARPARLAQALEAMKSWGYEYESHCVCAKQDVGVDRWFEEGHELVLVGVRAAACAPGADRLRSSLIEGAVCGRSGMQATLVDLIERYFPAQRKIDLFPQGALRYG